MTTSQNEIDRKASSALVLSSLSFVIIVMFVMMWPFREKISKIGKRNIRHCFKWTRKEVKKTRKMLSGKRQGGKVAEINIKALDEGKDPEESQLYATIRIKQEDSTGKRTPSQTSYDSDFSVSDNVIDDSGMVSVELHAYQTVALESCQQSSVLERSNLHPVRNSTRGLERNTGHVLDQTTGCCIYDEVEGNERNLSH